MNLVAIPPSSPSVHVPVRWGAMTVEELIAKLRLMPRNAELLALEPGCQFS
jgi:hypothetical protein